MSNGKATHSFLTALHAGEAKHVGRLVKSTRDVIVDVCVMLDRYLAEDPYGETATVEVSVDPELSPGGKITLESEMGFVIYSRDDKDTVDLLAAPTYIQFSITNDGKLRMELVFNNLWI